MLNIALTAALLSLAPVKSSEATVLIRDGRSDYRIVTAAQPSPTVTYAADELQRFLTQMTGVKLPVVSETRAGGGPAILIGPCEKTRRAGLPAEAARLREDGVLIRTLGRDVALIGRNERGNLYSVYVLLEKYLGVRFLAPDCTHVPQCKEVVLPELNYAYAPPFMYRETLIFESFPKEIAARQRLNGPFSKCDASVGGKVEIFPYVHSFDDLFPEKDYFKDHPEYYGLQGGKRVAGIVHAQLCLTNPDVLRLTKEKVLKWIEEHPEVPIIDVSQNDGNGACECEKCTAIVKEEGSQQGTILRFVNAVADEVAKKHPDKWIETLAYAYSLTPPLKTRPRDNVIIRLCHVGCYFHGFEQCNLGSDLKGWIDQWSSLTKRIFIWHYATNFGHYLAPNQNLEGLARDIKYYGARGVNGLMIQCDMPGPGGELAALRQYLSAQLMWDPTQEPMQLRSEFCRLYYGKASDAVMTFLRQMDDLGRKPLHAFGAWDPQNTVPPEFISEAIKPLEQALATADTPVIRNRVEKLMLAIWYMRLTFPVKYELSQEEAVGMLERARKVLDANSITYLSDGMTAPTWIATMEIKYRPQPKDVAYDFIRNTPAKVEHCADWRVSSVERDGKHFATIFHHPDGANDGDATYQITLPKDTRLALQLGTVITNASANGVRFVVLVNGREVWADTKTAFLAPKTDAEKSGQDSLLPTAAPFSDHTVDLSSYAGQTVSLTLRVNAMGNNANDWANWVEPRIVRIDR